jgi:hypothetical protein
MEWSAVTVPAPVKLIWKNETHDSAEFEPTLIVASPEVVVVPVGLDDVIVDMADNEPPEVVIPPLIVNVALAGNTTGTGASTARDATVAPLPSMKKG